MAGFLKFKNITYYTCFDINVYNSAKDTILIELTKEHVDERL